MNIPAERGRAQMMLQCGMLVTADTYASTLCRGLFTHYKREEDRNMRSGKFDEELVRMNQLTRCVTARRCCSTNSSLLLTKGRGQR